MTVTGIEEINNKKIRVFIDNELIQNGKTFTFEIRNKMADCKIKLNTFEK